MTKALEAADFYPLTWTQEQIWFNEQLYPGTPVYHISIAFTLRGTLDIGALDAALKLLIERHPALGTAVRLVNGHRIGQVTRSRLKLRLEDARAIPIVKRQAYVRDLLSADLLIPFDLGAGMLARVTLVRTHDTEHILCLIIHHLVCDAWSAAILLRDLSLLYDAARNNRTAELPSQSLTFQGYAWAQRHIPTDLLQTNLRFWRDQLQGSTPLRFERRIPLEGITPLMGSTTERVIPATIIHGLKQFSQRAGVTLFMSSLAAYAATLKHLTGQDDFTVATPFIVRQIAGSDEMVGLSMNILPLRINLSGDPTFLEIVRRVRGVCLESYIHQDAPFSQMVRMVNPPRGYGRNPLFETMLVLGNVPNQPFHLQGLDVSPYPTQLQASEFDLTIILSPDGDAMHASLEYSTALFTEKAALKVLSDWEAFAAQAVATPELTPRGYTWPAQDNDQDGDQGKWEEHVPEPFPPTQLPHQKWQSSPSRTAMVWEAITIPWTAELNCGSLSPEDNLFELGCSSLQLPTLAAIVRERLGLPLPLASFFQHTTLGALIDYIAGVMPDFQPTQRYLD